MATNTMNYIKKLQAQKALLTEKNAMTERILWELRHYLDSPKFRGEGEQWVNVADIFLRISEGLAERNELVDFRAGELGIDPL